MLICPQSLWVATDCQLNNNVRDITIVSILSYERRGHWWISKGITVWIFYERSFFWFSTTGEVMQTSKDKDHCLDTDKVFLQAWMRISIFDCQNRKHGKWCYTTMYFSPWIQHVPPWLATGKWPKTDYMGRDERIIILLYSTASATDCLDYNSTWYISNFKVRPNFIACVLMG